MIYESHTGGASVFNLIRTCMLAVPFVIWQVTCLFLLFCMVYRNRISWGMLSALAFVSVMLAVGYYERAQQWLVLSHDDVVMYMGPGTTYPRQASLRATDKVRLLSSRDGWDQVEYNGVIGWIEHA